MLSGTLGEVMSGTLGEVMRGTPGEMLNVSLGVELEVMTQKAISTVYRPYLSMYGL